MRRFKPNDAKYKEFVDDYGKAAYDIHTEKLNPGDEIVCPHDPNMRVKKNDDDSVTLIKKSRLRSVFSKK